MTPLTKTDFLTQLSGKLEVIPPTERQSILDYYDNFIQNAEDETTAITNLGTPGEVAAEVLASYVKKVSEPSPIPNSHILPRPATPLSSDTTHTAPPPNRDTFHTTHSPHHYYEASSKRSHVWWPLIIIAVLLSPAIIGIVIGVSGGALGIFVAAWSVVFAIAVSGFTFIVTGVISTAMSLPILFQDLGFGLQAAGMGLLLIGLGIFLIKLTIGFAKWIISLVQALIQKLTRRPYHG